MIQVETRVIQPDSVVEQHPSHLCSRATSVANIMQSLRTQSFVQSLRRASRSASAELRAEPPQSFAQSLRAEPPYAELRAELRAELLQSFVQSLRTQSFMQSF